MKKLFILLTLPAAQYSFAQSADTTDSTASKMQIRLGINFSSRLNYLGRTDDLESTGFFPLAELWFTPKFYVNAAPVFVSNKGQSFQYAGTVATIGYQTLTEKWFTNTYLLKPFYKEDAQLVQSALRLQGGLLASRLTSVLNLTVGGDIKLSDRLDYGASAGVDHAFRFVPGAGQQFIVDPSFMVYGGTQNFTRTYLRKKSDLVLVPGTEQVSENVQEFHILAYEASVPLIYLRDRWMLTVTPSYVMPQHLLTVAGRPHLSERGENMFYGTVGLKYSF